MTMAASIDDLVSMGDIVSLYEILVEHDDWMTQLDAAEGLAKLRDKRGLEFLISAGQSENRKIQEVAKEILDTPQIKHRLEDLKADEEEQHLERIQMAKKRLQK